MNMLTNNQTVEAVRNNYKIMEGNYFTSPRKTVPLENNAGIQEEACLVRSKGPSLDAFDDVWNHETIWLEDEPQNFNQRLFRWDNHIWEAIIEQVEEQNEIRVKPTSRSITITGTFTFQTEGTDSSRISEWENKGLYPTEVFTNIILEMLKAKQGIPMADQVDVMPSCNTKGKSCTFTTTTWSPSGHTKKQTLVLRLVKLEKPQYEWNKPFDSSKYLPDSELSYLPPQ
jgi:hypothetical protein